MVCYYVYNMEKQEAEATTVEVEYQTNCEDETQKVCPEQKYGGYGHQGCKEVKNQVISDHLFVHVGMNLYLFLY